MHQIYIVISLCNIFFDAPFPFAHAVPSVFSYLFVPTMVQNLSFENEFYLHENK